MNRRITALLIAIVVLARVAGRHYHQALRNTLPVLPITLRALPRPVAKEKCPAIPEPPPVGWHIRHDLREGRVVLPPAQPRPVVGPAEGGEK